MISKRHRDDDETQHARKPFSSDAFKRRNCGIRGPIPSFEGSPARALELVAVAHRLRLGPLPNRTTSAFDFRRHQPEYALTEVAIKPSTPEIGRQASCTPSYIMMRLSSVKA